MNVNDMTAQEAADWLASEVGLGPVSGQHCTERWDSAPDGESFLVPDPFPLTLDGAAAALPEGWKIWQLFQAPHGWYAYARHGDLRTGTEAPDEMTARYRLAVWCRMAAKEQS